MKRSSVRKWTSLIVVFLMAMAGAGLSSAEGTGLYKIASGDVLEIVVTDHPELSLAAPVIKDGTVSLPLLGSVGVEGLTVDEVRAKLEDMYNKNYIANPSVAINLKESRPKQFYVNGEVKLPGVYSLHDGVTVLKAIIMAGGFTDYASKSGVKVLRKVNGKEEVLQVNVKKIEGGDLAKDVDLQADDVVIVPESFL